MNNIRLIIQRYWQNDVQTEGDIQVLNDSLNVILKGVIIELKDLDNQNNISRIIAGDYEVVKRWSEKYGHHFHILNVKSRRYILIHSGNYFTETEGCVLVGYEYKDINGDGFNDAFKSRKFLDEMLEILPERFNLRIIDNIGIEL